MRSNTVQPFQSLQPVVPPTRNASTDSVNTTNATTTMTQTTATGASSTPRQNWFNSPHQSFTKMRWSSDQRKINAEHEMRHPSSDAMRVLINDVRSHVLDKLSKRAEGGQVSEANIDAEVLKRLKDSNHRFGKTFKELFSQKLDFLESQMANPGTPGLRILKERAISQATVTSKAASTATVASIMPLVPALAKQLHQTQKNTLTVKDAASKNEGLAVTKLLMDPANELASDLDRMHNAINAYNKVMEEIGALEAEIDTAAKKTLPQDIESKTPLERGLALFNAKHALLNTSVDVEHSSLQARHQQLKAKVLPSDEAVAARWELIASTMTDKTPEAIESEKTGYYKAWNMYITRFDSLAEAAKQTLDLQASVIPLSMTRSGDMYVKKEAIPESAAHSFTLTRQGPTYTNNGIVKNRGDANNFHAGMFSGDGNGQIDEERGGLGTTYAKRALNHKLQAGNFWVYRLPPMTFKATNDTASDNSASATGSTGSAQNQAVEISINQALTGIAQAFAVNYEPGEINRDGKKSVPYSSQGLGASMNKDAIFMTPTPETDLDAFKLAADPYLMPNTYDIKKAIADIKKETGRTPTTEEARARAGAEWKNNELFMAKRGKDKDGGSMCSAYDVEVLQTGHLQAAVAVQIKAEALSLKAKGQTLEQTTEFLNKKYMGDKAGLTPATLSIMEEARKTAPALFQVNPTGVSVQTFEHYLKDYEFVGVVVRKPEDLKEDDEEPYFDPVTGLQIDGPLAKKRKELEAARVPEGQITDVLEHDQTAFEAMKSSTMLPSADIPLKQ